jgi:hypothetical protein
VRTDTVGADTVGPRAMVTWTPQAASMVIINNENNVIQWFLVFISSP